MRNARRPLTAEDARFCTSMARRICAGAVEQVKDYEADARRKRRMVVRECRACFYFGGTVAGQAFTEWSCGICAETRMHGNTATPRVCGSCSEEHSVCTRCGGDLGMRSNRRKWPTPAPTPEAP